jgi:pilus assembly protein CpaB
MNRRRLVWIGIAALVAGGVLSSVVYRLLQQRIPVAAETIKVVVAANDIRAGYRILDQDLRILKYPAQLVPENALHTKDNVVGHGALVSIEKGDLILPGKISPATGPASLIPVGMRAERVRVSEFESDFLRPGDWVDVLVTGNASGSSETQTKTVLQDVRVLPTGSPSDASSTAESQKSPIVTLLVSLEDAERLTLASHEGRLKLVLRNPLDTDRAKAVTVTKATLYDSVGCAVRRTSGPPSRARSNGPSKDVDIQILHGTRPENVHIKE